MNKYLPLFKWLRFSGVFLFWLGTGLSMAEANGTLDGPGFGYLIPWLKDLPMSLLLTGAVTYIMAFIFPKFLKLKVKGTDLSYPIIPILWFGGFLFIGRPLMFWSWEVACESKTDGRGCYGAGNLKKTEEEKLIWYEKGVALFDGNSMRQAVKLKPEEYKVRVCGIYQSRCPETQNGKVATRLCLPLGDLCK
jgi:hypothetical protein